MELVFATHNNHKLAEVRLLLPENFRLLSLQDIGCSEEIAETGSTLQDNALIKANYVFENYHYSCFADDTGLLVDALKGEPGVHSARYAGDQKNARDNIEKLLSALRLHSNRSAQFETVIALRMEDTTELFKGIVRGAITEELKGDGGFGYDPVFIPEGYRHTFAEMSLDSKNNISHRARALNKLSDYLAGLSCM